MVKFYNFFCYVMLCFFAPKNEDFTIRTEQLFWYLCSLPIVERLFYCVLSMTNYRTFVLKLCPHPTPLTMRTEQTFYRTTVRQNRSVGFRSDYAKLT
jgi:hypothetical protein